MQPVPRDRLYPRSLLSFTVEAELCSFLTPSLALFFFFFFFFFSLAGYHRQIERSGKCCGLVM